MREHVRHAVGPVLRRPTLTERLREWVRYRSSKVRNVDPSALRIGLFIQGETFRDPVLKGLLGERRSALRRQRDEHRKEVRGDRAQPGGARVHLGRAGVNGRYYLCSREQGRARVVVVLAKGLVVPLRHVVRHSPTGFEWGYSGSGPADLALSILADHLGLEDEEIDSARGLTRAYEQFKSDFVAHWPRHGACLCGSEIEDWFARTGLTVERGETDEHYA